MMGKEGIMADISNTLTSDVNTDCNRMYCYSGTTVTNTGTVNRCYDVSRTSSNHPKKSRTVFTKKQILKLEGVFYEKRYLTIKDREELSKSLSLTESQVKVWFQNRRNKWKREMAFKVEYAKFNTLPRYQRPSQGSSLILPTYNPYYTYKSGAQSSFNPSQYQAQPYMGNDGTKSIFMHNTCTNSTMLHPYEQTNKQYHDLDQNSIVNEQPTLSSGNYDEQNQINRESYNHTIEQKSSYNIQEPINTCSENQNTENYSSDSYDTQVKNENYENMTVNYNPVFVNTMQGTSEESYRLFNFFNKNSYECENGNQQQHQQQETTEYTSSELSGSQTTNGELNALELSDCRYGDTRLLMLPNQNEI